MEKSIKKILLIEDEKPLARALEIKLRHEGFNITVLSSGETFSKIIDEQKFSLIISDLIMPNVDGFSILEILKMKKITTPVFILTNLSQVEDEQRALSLGASKFFVKTDTSLSSIIDFVKEQIS